MPVEGLNARKELAVIPAGDQHLGVRAGGCLEDGKWAGGEFMLFDDGDFIFTV